MDESINKTLEISTENLDKLIDLGVKYGLKVAGALLVLALAWVVANLVRRAMRKKFTKSNLDPALAGFFTKLVRYAILIGALLGILGGFGVETTSFAALIAAMGLAAGLAVKGTLANFAAGVMLLAFRPFKIDDLVEVNGEIGRVKEIHLFTTEIATLDNRKVILPNDAVFGQKIVNITHYPVRRVDIPVGLTYRADIDQTRAVLEKAAIAVPQRVEDPPIQVLLKEFGSSSVNWVVRVWCNTEEYWATHDATVRSIKIHLDEARLSIPFPQMDVHLDKPTD